MRNKVYDLLDQNIIKGASHLYAGQEAVAVGAIAALRDDDLITSTHRGHGHCHARGDSLAAAPEAKQEHLNKMMAELCGRATGYCKGRGGSMHIADVQKGNLGATGIVGGNIPVATGAALSMKLQKTDRVVVCFFGDGAIEHRQLSRVAEHGLGLEAAGGLCGGEQPLRHVACPLTRSAPCPISPPARAAYDMPGVVRGWHGSRRRLRGRHRRRWSARAGARARR